MQYLLRHRSSIYNGHLQGSVTLTLNAERLELKLTQPVFTTYVFEHPTFRLREERFCPLPHRRIRNFISSCDVATNIKITPTIEVTIHFVKIA